MPIKPHGADALRPLFVTDPARREALAREAATLPALTLNSAAAANAVMLAAGYFTPLAGFMNLADALSVAERLRTTGGLFWPVPVVNLTRDAEAIKGARRIALRDPNADGNPVLAVMTVEAVEAVSGEQLERIAQQVFGTQLLREGLPGHLPQRSADPRGDRQARVEEGGRVPDPQPDAPRARGAVPHGEGPAARRRHRHPHAARQAQAG
jgi:ATP sulfurylase